MAVVQVEIGSNQCVILSYRIVDTDNFGGDYPDERFVAIGIASKEVAECFADAWNKRMGEQASRYLKVVEHTEIVYKLQPGFEP